MLKALSVSSLVVAVLVVSIATTFANAISLATTDVTHPVLKEAEHGVPDFVHAGDLLVIATTITNGEDFEKPFVVIVETREDTGVTVDLQFQAGKLDANSGTEVGVLWRPETAGEYELRAFAISDFNNPKILTGVRTSQVEISSA